MPPAAFVSTPPTRRTRRVFLRLASATAGAIVTQGCSLGSSASPAAIGDLPAGTVASLPVGSLQAVGSNPACVGRDAGGVYAMTLTCTHQGCNMALQGSVSAQGIVCSCHGSRFDPNGNPTAGPAGAPLVHYAVSEDGAGNLTIHGETEVGAGVRLMV